MSTQPTPVGIRIDQDLKRQLKVRAALADRSLTKEIAFRLKASLEQEDAEKE